MKPDFCQLNTDAAANQNSPQQPTQANNAGPRGLLSALMYLGFGLLACFLLIVLIQPRISLNIVHQQVEQAGEQALGRELTMAGDTFLKLGLSPTLELNDITIANADSFEGDFAHLAHASLQVHLLPLLKQRIAVGHVDIANMTLNLQRYDDINNWTFAMAQQGKLEPSQTNTEAESEVTAKASRWKLQQVDGLTIKALVVNQQVDEQTPLQYQIDHLHLAALSGEGLSLQGQGAFAGIPYQLRANAQVIKDQIAYQTEVTIGAAVLSLNGDFNKQTRLGDSELSLHVPSVQHLPPAMATSMGPLLPIKASAQLQTQRGLAQLTVSQLDFAGTHMEGLLDVNIQQLPYQIGGHLNADIINIGHWLDQDTEDDNFAQPVAPDKSAITAGPLVQAKARKQQQLARQEQAQIIALINQTMAKLDVNLAFSLEQLIGLDVAVNDAELALKLKNNQLNAPLRLSLAQVPFNGELEVKAKEKQLQATLNLATQDSEVGQLGQWLLGVEGVAGKVEQAQLSVSTRGRHLAQLLKRTRLTFDLYQGHLVYPGQQPVSLELSQAKLAMGFHRATIMTMEGRLMALPFSLNVMADAPKQLQKNEPWQVKIDFKGPETEVKLVGAAADKSMQDSELSLHAKVNRLGAIAPWLNINPDSEEPLEMSGVLRLSQGQWQFDLPQMLVGKSKGELAFKFTPQQTAKVAAVTSQGATTNTHLALETKLKTLDLPGLKKLAPAAIDAADKDVAQAEKSSSDGVGLALSMPILPSKVRIMDADIGLHIERILLAKHHVDNLIIKGKIEDGWLTQTPFSFAVSGNRFAGDMSLDLRTEKPAFKLDLTANKPRLGQVLNDLGVVDDLSLDLNKMALTASFEGANVAQILASMQIKAGLYGGQWTLTDSNTGAQAEIKLFQGELTANKTAPLWLNLNGQLKQQDFNLDLRTASIAEIAKKPQLVPLNMSAKLAGIVLTASSQVALPINKHNLNLALEASMPNLQELNKFSAIELPPYGPIALSGRFKTTPQGYFIEQLDLAVAQSELSGQIGLTTASAKPQFSLALTAPSIQLNDFKAQGWSLFGHDGDSDEHDADKPAQSSPPKDAQQNEPGNAILSPQSLQQFDAKVAINVEKVLSGQDPLGDGHLRFKLANGKAELQGLNLNIPGGQLEVKGHLFYQGEQANTWLNAEVENFEYGVMAHRIDPKSTISGSISLDVDLNAKGSDPKVMMESATGHFHVQVVPRQIRANIFDIWAVSLVSTILPKVVPEKKSDINCIVGRFNFEQGMINEDIILADTSNMQVFAQTQINLATKDLRVRATPRAKTAQLFSLETPIEVSGNIDDFKIKVASGDLFETSYRFITSPLVAPLKWIADAPVNKSGQPQCQLAWQGKLKQSGRKKAKVKQD
ncbi:AsmA family protein [Motilimonas pumila]|uniref:AsmA family protein n=1 Tax=Motilimonas pumila TaxID=2303987 RepID=A0A418YF48_9GAMM|nr:AsmA family protein [Motilimonas pumila]RJG47755.1 AsmA family protein [Motilimonas pumila]